MLKVLVAGIVLGVAGAVAALYYLPVVDQVRETSIITVTPNGGNAESFHVNIPGDHIMHGAQDRQSASPVGMKWPEDAVLRGLQADLFKLRNQRDVVVGVASRVAIQNAELGNVVEWVLHLPARGSLFAAVSPTAGNGARNGELHGGTGEFSGLGGSMSERWVAGSDAGGQGGGGRIELLANYLAVARPDPVLEESLREGVE